MELTYYLCDSQMMEVGVLPRSAEMDMELGGGYNDAQIICEPGLIEFGGWVFCPGTEYIARFEQMTISTDTRLQTWTGNGIRKFLDQAIIQPPSGYDYKTVSGELNAILRSILSGLYDGLFTVPDTATNKTITWRFDRYCTVLEGLEKMLKSVGYRLQIKAEQGGPSYPFSIVMQAVPIQDFSSDIEWSEDSNRVVRIDDNRRGINHLICLGQGELHNRVVRHLYAWPDRSIQTRQYYTGIEERTEVYDYPSAESEAVLISEGKKRFEELITGKTMTVTILDASIEIGDLVGGKSYEHGVSFLAAIRQKIVTVSSGVTSIEYITED